MRWYQVCAGVTVLGLLVTVGILLAGEPQADGPGKRAAKDAVLGEVLFTDVVSVHFVGPALPANSDGSLGGLAAGDAGEQLTIYEHYIVRDAADAEGRTLRTLYAYETLGKIEQRLSRLKVAR